jgi:kynureninase
LRQKSTLLTSYLQFSLESSLTNELKIVTPSDEERRGCQLSLLLLKSEADTVASMLKDRGIICDTRKDNILRIAPVPLYNSFNDVLKVVLSLKDIFMSIGDQIQ